MKNGRASDGAPGRLGFLVVFVAGLVEEADEVLAAAGLLQLADGLGLDLADTFAGHLEDVAHLFQGVAVAVAQAVAELDNLPLAVAERLEHLGDSRAKHLLGRADSRAAGAAVGQQIAEMAVLAVAHRPVEADRVAAHGQHAPRLVDAGFAGPGGLFDGRLASQLLQ